MIKLIFLTVITWSNPTPDDSLRMESINGKLFIIHQVAEKETLYSISRRYGTPITAILEYNPKAASGLEVGQLVNVLYVSKSKAPSAGGTMHKVAAKETLFSISKLYDVPIEDLKTWNNLKDNGLTVGQELIVRKSTLTKEIVKAPDTKAGTHIVEPKETLFAIARKYNISVQQLREWNSIQGDDVKVGQLLIVAQLGVTAVTVPRETKTEEVRPILPIKEEVKEPKENTVRISENVAGTDEVKQGGLAELIEGTEGNRKYLALHKTAKAGAIIKVRNELNNREVFVRVVGPLPATGANENVVIKISKSAFDRLGAIDSRFRVEVTYYK